MTTLYMPLIFSVAITLHNIEEALWLPEWSLHAERYHKPVTKKEFRFAVLCVTVLAYITSFLFILYGDVFLVRYIFFGFIGAMIINAILPHLVMTVILRKYAPGLLTGVFINLPFFSIIIVKAIELELVSLLEFFISTVIVGLTILGILPTLFKLGNRVLRFEDKDV